MKKQESVFIIPNTYWHMHNNTGNENVGVVFVCWVSIGLSEPSLTSGHRYTGPCLMAFCSNSNWYLILVGGFSNRTPISYNLRMSVMHPVNIHLSYVEPLGACLVRHD